MSDEKVLGTYTIPAHAHAQLRKYVLENELYEAKAILSSFRMWETIHVELPQLGKDDNLVFNSKLMTLTKKENNPMMDILLKVTNAEEKKKATRRKLEDTILSIEALLEELSIA